MISNQSDPVMSRLHQLKSLLLLRNWAIPPKFYIDKAYSQPGQVVIAPNYYKNAIKNALEADRNLWTRTRVFDEVVLYQPDPRKGYYRNLLTFKWPGWRTQLFLLICVVHYGESYYNGRIIVQFS